MLATLPELVDALLVEDGEVFDELETLALKLLFWFVVLLLAKLLVDDGDVFEALGLLLYELELLVLEGELFWVLDP